MPDHVNLRKMNCPSCGAPVELAGAVGTCEYCGARLERAMPAPEEKSAEKKVEVQVVQWPSVQATPVVIQPSGGSSCLGLLIVPIILLFIGGIVAASLWMSGSAMFSSFESFSTVIPSFATAMPNIPVGTPDRTLAWSITNGPAALIPVGDGLSPDVLVSGYHPFDNVYGLLYLEGETHNLRWKSEPVQVSSSSAIFVGTNHIYVISETDLFAINRTDGATAWQASVVDLVYGHICRDCLQQIGNSVVVLSQDGTLQAYNADTGQPLWSTLLHEQPRQLVAVNGLVGVYDQESDDAEVDLFLYNPADGTLAHQLSPRCPNESFPDSPQGPGIYTPMYPADGGKTLYIAGGFFEPGCLQRWDMTTNTMVWQTTMPTDLLRDDANDLVTDTTFYFSNGDIITAINKADGTMRELINEPDYAFTPLGEQAGLLLVSARRERGTQRDELWALDATSGERRWQYVPQATGLLNESTGIVYTSEPGLWTWHFTNQGVLVLQGRSEPNRLVLETLQLQDGVSTGGQQTIELETTSQWNLEVIGWQGDTVWLKLDDKVAVVDTAEATIRSSWP
jgi:outer membrane protein assembly factor BamB